MDSLGEILGKKNFKAPDEISAVKAYIMRRYNSSCTVKLQRNALIVRVPSSALAATIHLERQQLVQACGIKQKLVIRAGS